MIKWLDSSRSGISDLKKNQGLSGWCSRIGTGSVVFCKCGTPSSLEEGRPWFIVFSGVCEINTPKMADLSNNVMSFGSQSFWKFDIWLWQAGVSQIQHIVGRMGNEMCFYLFVFVLRNGILHCKWKCFRSEIQSNSTGPWGTFEHWKFRKLCGISDLSLTSHMNCFK